MNEELQEFLRTPREDLDIELKKWIDPSDKNVQAKLAKELLALRNHGGGFLVIGFKDGHPPVPDPDRPTDLAGFSTDVFNNIIKRYAEPPFHCMSYVVDHPVSGDKYPVVVVPGGAKVPVRCKSDSPDGRSIKLDTYYIRRPGPESSPPQSGTEWDLLLERCLLGRKEELLSSLSILLGAGRAGLLEGMTLPEAKHPFAALRNFRDVAVSRLEHLQQTKLAEGDGARFQHGRYILSAGFVGDLRQVDTPEILSILSGLRKYTGWSPLNVFSRDELAPYLVDNNLIECWLGRAESSDIAHADYWRASTEGMVTLIRGHQEDGADMAKDHLAPGTVIELTIPAWRVAEFILRVKELGLKLAKGPFRMQLIVQWEGLDNRKLYSHDGRYRLYDDYVAHDANYSIEIEVSPEDIDSALPTVLATAINPLLRRFSFFEPPRGFYEREMARMLNREYS